MHLLVCYINVKFYSKNTFEKLVHLVGFIVRKALYGAETWALRENRTVLRFGAGEVFRRSVGPIT